MHLVDGNEWDRCFGCDLQTDGSKTFEKTHTHQSSTIERFCVSNPPPDMRQILTLNSVTASWVIHMYHHRALTASF